jgi:hypothetical protein
MRYSTRKAASYNGLKAKEKSEMILDTKLTFSENQAVTATAISTNVIEFPDNDIVPGEAAAIARHLGAGNEIPLTIQITEAFATATSVTFTLESADNAGLSTNAVVHWTSGAVAIATLTAGYKLPVRILPNGAIKKYLGMRYTIGGSNATAGKVTAALATEQDGGWSA